MQVNLMILSLIRNLFPQINLRLCLKTLALYSARNIGG